MWRLQPKPLPFITRTDLHHHGDLDIVAAARAPCPKQLKPAAWRGVAGRLAAAAPAEVICHEPLAKAGCRRRVHRTPITVHGQNRSGGRARSPDHVRAPLVLEREAMELGVGQVHCL